MITPEELATRFTYHPPRTGQPETYEAIRDAAKAFAMYLVALTPESREQSLAVTAIEEAVFWANAAIARRESYRPQPGPVADRDGRANWSAFWSEAKRLGFDAKAVHALAGTKSLAHLEPEAVEDLLNVMRDREGYARPAGDEKCVALTASWCGTEQRNAKRPPHGSLQGSVRRGRGSAEDPPGTRPVHGAYRGPHQGHRQSGLR